MKSKAAAASAAAFTLAILSSNPVWAQEAPVAEEVHQISYNVALTNEYRYRGLAQSRFDPALQGGIDYVHAPSGFYVGTWMSTIKWIEDSGGSGNLEVDLYAGKRGQLSELISYDVGGLFYGYPSNGLPTNANTFELYGQLGIGPAYVKYSHATSNLFGVADSKRSGYLDIGANVDLGEGVVLNLHAGRQRVKNSSAWSYSDYKIGATKDFGYVAVSLAWVKANNSLYTTPDGRKTGRSAALLSVSKTF